MPGNFLDAYRPATSVAHRLDARVKLVLAIVFVLATTLAPGRSWPVHILLLSLVLAAAIAAEVGPLYIFRRSVVVLPFALAVVPMAFASAGEPLFCIPLVGGGVTVSPAGIERAAAIVFKSWISVQWVIVLAATTPFPDLLAAMRSLGVPSLLVAVIGVMWRYIFVLTDEASRLMRARAARSGEIPGRRCGGSLIWRARVAGGLAGNLFVRTLYRSERIYMAMVSRGYTGDVLTLTLPPLNRRQSMIMWIGIGLAVSLIGLAYLMH